MKYEVRTLQNKKAGEVNLNPAIFGLPVRSDILARMVNWQLAKRRSGNHQTKTISMVSGTTKKPFKQKGTGNARAGSLRAPQMRGGATVFGPQTRDHAHKLPKKVRVLALKTALSSKVADGSLLIIDDIAMKSPKTKDLTESIKSLGLKTALIIDGEKVNENFARAAQNVPGLDVLPQQGINVYDILRREHLVITKSALETLEGRLA